MVSTAWQEAYPEEVIRHYKTNPPEWELPKQPERPSKGKGKARAAPEDEAEDEQVNERSREGSGAGGSSAGGRAASVTLSSGA